MPKNKFVNKECKKHGNTEYVLEGRGYYRCKKCRSDSVSERRRKVKKLLVDHFGGKCTICGYDSSYAAMQFHHEDPTTKEFGIGSNGLTKGYETLKKEAEKCILLCANCHAKIHSTE